MQRITIGNTNQILFYWYWNNLIEGSIYKNYHWQSIFHFSIVMLLGIQHDRRLHFDICVIKPCRVSKMI